jgi:hypothetical protein
MYQTTVRYFGCHTKARVIVNARLHSQLVHPNIIFNNNYAFPVRGLDVDLDHLNTTVQPFLLHLVAQFGLTLTSTC